MASAIKVELDDVLEFIDHCNHSEQAQIKDAVGAGEPEVAQPDCSNTLYNAINKPMTLDQEEKLLFLIENIDAIKYEQLKQLCEGSNQ